MVEHLVDLREPRRVPFVALPLACRGRFGLCVSVLRLHYRCEYHIRARQYGDRQLPPRATTRQQIELAG